MGERETLFDSAFWKRAPQFVTMGRVLVLGNAATFFAAVVVAYWKPLTLIPAAVAAFWFYALLNEGAWNE